MDARSLGDVDDDLDVGIVVVIRAAGHLDVLVGHANVVGVDTVRHFLRDLVRPKLARRTASPLVWP
jgi:energy-converting hydrogenase Eha subunit C